MKKRTIEVFTAGCPCCDEAVQLVKSLTCESCDVQVLDMRSDRAAQARAREYGLRRVPAVVVNGRLADCWWRGGRGGPPQPWGRKPGLGGDCRSLPWPPLTS